MYNYDAALKTLLTESGAATVRAVSGLTIQRWHNVELTVKQCRVDLLGETNRKRLLHIELQSRNDAAIARRMYQYGGAIWAKHGRYPKQVLLYVGRDRMRMPTGHAANEDFTYRYAAVDIRDLDEKQLMESGGIGDNVLALLAGSRNERKTVREILERIAGMDESKRESTLEQLTVLAGLRHLVPLVQEEANRMPITENILDHELIGPAYKKGRRVGRKEGELAMLRRLIEKRFGAVPPSLEERLESASRAKLEEIGLRVLDAQSAEDLVK